MHEGKKVLLIPDIDNELERGELFNMLALLVMAVFDTIIW